MDNYLSLIKKSKLFFGIEDNELKAMLQCLSAKKCVYEKNQFVFRCGDRATSVGMVLEGRIHIIKEDFWGNRNIISEIVVGELFAGTYACSPSAALPVSVIAIERTTTMFIDVNRILTTCPSACEFHSRLIKNLLASFAEKTVLLTEKLQHMAERTTRAKLLSFLSAEALKRGTPSFTITLNRQQLADYLSVDRSAMSNELCKMRDEGILTFDRNSFVLH